MSKEITLEDLANSVKPTTATEKKDTEQEIKNENQSLIQGKTEKKEIYK